MDAGDCPTLNMNAMENYLLSQSLRNNTLLRALWARTRVTNKPENCRPDGFSSTKPAKPEAKCFAPILNWCNHRTLQDIIRIVMYQNKHFTFSKIFFL